MKAFLTTLKGKIIAAVATVAVVGGVTTAVVLSNSGYRTIAVKQLTGVTHVANNGSVVDAHVGQHLKSGDDVKVTEASNIVLSLDSDKFVYAEANTHFWIEATGKESDSRTKIHLDSGSVISRIDNKLKDSETFEVETPNGTMSVRGTVFKVDCYVNENGETMSELSVLDGEVYIGAVTEEGRVLTEDTTIAPGEKITIKSDPTVSEFVRVEGGTGDGLTESIDLGDFTQGEANFIGLSIDEGKEYYFTKEVLFHKAEIEEHSFDGVAREVAATCTEDGYTFEE
ncbi:MAG: FecR domain-containing protein, partial [Eubacteriales bacterium]|nr:FecR domain-containing protein [Eubacteriales bacterium]